jgi:Sulfatase-modifying factor enzyme 1
MGSDDFYPEEGPVHGVSVSGFWMDEHAVTVAEYRRFASATGYVTVAERAPHPDQYLGMAPELLVPGSLVFDQPDGPVDLNDPRNWWSWVPGAQWRHPEGLESTLHGRERHPVTHVAYEEAAAFAVWAGKALPLRSQMGVGRQRRSGEGCLPRPFQDHDVSPGMVRGLVDVAGGFAGGRAVRPGGVRQWRGSESGRSAVPRPREPAAHRVSKLRGAAFTSSDGTGAGEERSDEQDRRYR